MFTRRTILKMSTATLAAPAVLGGCSLLKNGKNPLQLQVKVTLANAQAQASAMLEAATVVEQSAVKVLSKAAQATAAKALAAAQTAVKAFTGLKSGSSSVATFATNVISALSQVVAVIPMPPATSMAVTEGLALLQALIAGLSSITVAQPTGLSAGVGATRVIPAPIPIPVS